MHDLIYSLLLIPVVFAAVCIGEPENELIRPKRQYANGSFLRPCYFTNWAQYRKPRARYMPEDYIPGLCTHILFAFGWMNEDFTIRAFDPADLPNDWAGQGMFRRVNALKQQDRELKTLLSIGGWSFGTRLFEEMARSDMGRQKFISSAIAFVRKWNFDGIDIDWEYPRGPSVRDHFTALITELRTAVDSEAISSSKPRLLVTAAVSAGIATIDQAYDIPKLAQPFDFVNLMSYDFWGAWDGIVGMNSPLHSRADLSEPQKYWNIDWAAKHWIEKGMPKEKLLIGIGTYGRGFTLKESNMQNALGSTGNSPAKITEYVQEAGVAAYFELCEMLAKGAQRHWHTEHAVPYLTNGSQWWSYDDEESVSKKVAYVKKEGFGGAFVWTLDFDDFNAKCTGSSGQPYPLISIIARELGGVEIRRATTPLPTPAPETTTSPRQNTVTSSLPVQTTPYSFTLPPMLNKCAGLPDGFHRSETSCAHFILCLKGAGYPLLCPTGLHFSASKGYCMHQAEAGCSQLTSTIPVSTTTIQPSTGTTSQSKFSCAEKADGFFPDPDNCSSFYRCVAGTAYHFNCPPSTFFNSKTSDCDTVSKDNCPKY